MELPIVTDLQTANNAYVLNEVACGKIKNIDSKRNQHIGDVTVAPGSATFPPTKIQSRCAPVSVVARVEAP